MTTSSIFFFIELVFIAKKFKSISKNFIKIFIFIEIFIDLRIGNFFRNLIILLSGYAKQVLFILFSYFFIFFNNFLYSLYLIMCFIFIIFNEFRYLSIS